jgi:PAS domain S-box-containing protein
MMADREIATLALAALATMPAAVVTLDSQLRVTWINELALRRLQKSMDDVLGQHWTDLWPQAAVSGEIYRRCLGGESIDIKSLSFDFPDGPRYLDITLRPMRDAAGRVQGIMLVGWDVTDRKLAELALHASEQRLEMAMRAADVALWTWDMIADHSDETDSWFRITGYDKTFWRAEDHPWAKRVHPEDKARVFDAVSDFAQGRSPAYEIDYRFLAASGRWIWFLDRAAVVARDSAGRATLLAGTSIDITDRKTAEQSVKQSESILRSLTASAPDWLALLDQNLCIQFINRSLIGLLPEELMGRTALSLLGTANGIDIGAALGRTLRARETLSFETQLGCDGAQMRYFENLAAPVVQDDKVLGVSLRISEITERRRNEQTLRRQALILETMREGVILFSESNRIEWTNPAISRLFGYDATELLHMAVESLGLTHCLDHTAADDTAPKSDSSEFVGHRKDGSDFLAEIVFNRISVSGWPLVIGVLQDVTSRKQLEREILEVANREQQRIGNDLHDGLGQELTGIALLMRTLADRMQSDYPQGKAAADEIIAFVNQAIENTRALARGLSPVSLGHGGLIEALRALTRHTRERYGVDIRLRTRSPGALSIDEATANHLYRIAQESVTNAVRHAKAQVIDVKVRVRGDAIELIVADNGAGIAEPPMQTAGMGLRIMAYRARMIGAQLIIAATPSGGTQVRCECPQLAVATIESASRGLVQGQYARN